MCALLTPRISVSEDIPRFVTTIVVKKHLFIFFRLHTRGGLNLVAIIDAYQKKLITRK